MGNIFLLKLNVKLFEKSCKYILDLVHPPEGEQILQDKNISIDVVNVFNFPFHHKIKLRIFGPCTFDCHVEMQLVSEDAFLSQTV